MKKILMTFAAFLSSAVIFAYNPPVGGQSLYNLSSPTQIASASSSAGGGIFLPGPDSIAFNPALTAFEQRIILDAGFTFLYSSKNDYGKAANSAIQTGILIPTKRFVASGVMNGVFVEADDMYLGNTLNLRCGLAKEVTETISVGANITGGLLWDVGNSWSLGADLGVLYRKESLACFKDFRIGGALLNLGKGYGSDEVLPLDEKHKSDDFPALVTLKTGCAALFLSTEQFKGGFSFDLALPTFQDAIISMGVNFSIKDIVYLNIAETIDVAELKDKHNDLMPAISLGFKINLNAKNNSYLKAHDWDSSEMLASLAWQQKYESIQAVSGGARLYLGMQDTQAPVIQLWNGEDD